MTTGINPKDAIGVKKAPLRFVPAALSLEASGPMADGARKYGPYNWRETPILMSGYLEATERHLLALKDGQDLAEDSGHSHIGHIAANMGILADAKAHGTLIDDRFVGPAPDILRRLDKSITPAEPAEPAITTEPWGSGDGPVFGMDRSGWNAHGRTPVVPETKAEPTPRFLCGHAVGDEPTESCGSAVHWSRVNGIDLKNPPLELDCNCKTDWSEHSFDCPLFHVDKR